ncbi:MAG: hypothetical protein ABIG11_10830 [bacterium]
MGVIDRFMSSSPDRLKSCMGICLSLDGAVICETALDANGAVRTEQILHVPFPPQSPEQTGRAGSMNAAFFSEKVKWPETLQQAMGQAGFKTGRAVVTLSSSFCIVRHFVMPKIDRRFWNQSVPLESRKYIPISFDDVSYDFQARSIEPAPDGKQRMGVLFGITNRKAVEFLREIFRKAGVEMLAVEMSAGSVERLMLHLGRPSGTGRVHFDAAAVHILLSSEGFPLLYREIRIGDDAQLTERRKLDLKGSIEFVSKQMGIQPFAALEVSGDSSEVWKTMAEKESGLPVQTWNPAKELFLKEAADWSTMAAIGASIRLQADNPLSLDISGESRAVAEEKNAIFYLWSAGMLLCGFILLLSLITAARLLVMDGQLRSKKNTVPDIPEFQGQTAESIEDIVHKMKSRLDTLSAIVGNADILTPKLSALADITPPNIWIMGIAYSNPFTSSALRNEGQELTLTGKLAVSEEEKGVPQVDAFTTAVKESPEFSASFKPPLGSIEFTITGGSNQAQNPFAEAQGKFILFSLICKKQAPAR